jgi:hypothetical protein
VREDVAVADYDDNSDYPEKREDVAAADYDDTSDYPEVREEVAAAACDNISDYLEVGKDVAVKHWYNNSYYFETCEDVPVADFEKVFYKRNSIVYSPTTVHFTNKGYSGLITLKLTILLFDMILVCQGFPLSLPGLVLL